MLQFYRTRNHMMVKAKARRFSDVRKSIERIETGSQRNRKDVAFREKLNTVEKAPENPMLNHEDIAPLSEVRLKLHVQSVRKVGCDF
mmetsp:Transcript_24098/g.33698  ORF Transcript_24098/g.33698 Transcript_24098/m.33698 type:complete len:87 (+) Transcript_24098:41-301(+)